jgi:hypothetical protein
MEKLAKLNKQLVVFCSVALLFSGSLFYLISVAFKNRESISETKQNRDINDYLKGIEEY